jgi:hypothetical protein
LRLSPAAWISFWLLGHIERMKQDSTSLPARRKYLIAGVILFAVGGLAGFLFVLFRGADSWDDWFEPVLFWGFAVWFFLLWKKGCRKDDHAA